MILSFGVYYSQYISLFLFAVTVNVTTPLDGSFSLALIVGVTGKCFITAKLVI